MPPPHLHPYANSADPSKLRDGRHPSAITVSDNGLCVALSLGGPRPDSVRSGVDCRASWKRLKADSNVRGDTALTGSMWSSKTDSLVLLCYKRRMPQKGQLGSCRRM